jgi:hypothetical protein
MHGIGFASSVDSLQYGLSAGSSCFPYSLDRFIKLTNSSGVSSMLTSYPACTPSSILATLLTNNNVWYDSQVCSGADYRLFAPYPFQPGSSISHFNESTYPVTNPNSLMTNSLSAAEAIHDPGPFGYCVLKDICWKVDYALGASDDVIISTPTATTLTQLSTYNFNCIYYDYDLSSISSFNYTGNCWKLILPTKNMGDYVHMQSNGITTGASNQWSLNLFALPSGPTWCRNNDGTVRAYIEIKGYDTDGYLHSDRIPISIKLGPDKPLLDIAKSSTACNAIKMSFFSSGATSYILYWGNTSGAPYSSNYNFTGNQTVYIVTGLSNGTKYFNVKGKNLFGTSSYADQKNITLNCKTKGGSAVESKLLLNAMPSINIFPNPTVDFIKINNIDLDKQNIIYLVDLQGKTIDVPFEATDNNSINLDLRNIASGLYLVSVINEEGNAQTFKIVKN